ncbi:MAG: VapC toxin family PIN domain ribonuclease [Candidatus Hydrogenedentes bacterium]|nr:VapC toxin family PIN domain ribonuclease [Candidatus Hydrogenedentota bacterium]
MILVDVNLLVYAHANTFSEHERARVWLDNQLMGSTKVALPWQSLVGFVRIVTNPRIFDRPSTVAEAWDQVRAWLDCDVAWIPQATERHSQFLERLLFASGVRGDVVADAHLAALAVEHGLMLCSTDGDFARFPGLRWSNPIAPQ